MGRNGSLLAATLVAGLVGGAASATAASFTVIYTAPTNSPLTPEIGAVQGNVIYGIDPARGSAGFGLLFTLKPQGGGYSFAPFYNFQGFNDGQTPNPRLIVDGTGGVYGTAESGGNHFLGSVFHISGSGAFVWAHSLQTSEGIAPLDGLAVDALGNMYGTTSGGAISPGNGTVFRVTRNGTFHIVHYFLSQADGHCPFTGVVVDRQQAIHGTTVGMGFGGQPLGSLWQWPRGGTLTTQHEFSDTTIAPGTLTDGLWPRITPTLDAAGDLWGTNIDYQGAVFAGAIWEMTAGGSFSAVYNFSGGADGYEPNGQLLLGLDGNLYGTTLGGGNATGTAGNGVLYRITPSTGSVTPVHTFASAEGTPTGSLAQDTAGNIYGGTNAGVAYRYTP